jgi:hypothetical protein
VEDIRVQLLEMLIDSPYSWDQKLAKLVWDEKNSCNFKPGVPL